VRGGNGSAVARQRGRKGRGLGVERETFDGWGGTVSGGGAANRRVRSVNGVGEHRALFWICLNQFEIV
jgi:hypothetical protein